MGDDPLHLGVLDAEVIQEAVDTRKKKKPASETAALMRAETAAKKEERLAQGGSTARAPAPAPVVEPDPVQDKSLLLDKVTAYRERFPHLKSRNKVTGKSSIDEIADELHYLEQQLGQKEGHMGHQVFQLAMSGIEEVTTKHYNPLGLNLMGLSQVARDNQAEFAPILDELFIKYATNMYVGPEMRLVMATATLVYTVHSANSGNPAVAKAMQQMSQTVTPKPTDL